MTGNRALGLVGKTIEWFIYIVAGLFIFVWFWSMGPMRIIESRPYGIRTRDQAGMQSLSTAISSYVVEHGYPPVPRRIDGVRADASALREAGGGDLNYPSGLTTPIAFLAAYPDDGSLQLPHAYWIHGDWYALSGPGPDKKYDLSSPTLPAAAPLDDPGPFLERRFGYDPTNGGYSSGDILRVERWR